jgi:hypothetical protein
MTGKTIRFRDLPPDERKELIAALESDVATLRYVAGDRIEDLCESVQDAVNEVIAKCRECGMRYEQDFDDLRIQAYAFPRPVGKGISWGLNSLVTGINTKRGIVE